MWSLFIHPVFNNGVYSHNFGILPIEALFFLVHEHIQFDQKISLNGFIGSSL